MPGSVRRLRFYPEWRITLFTLLLVPLMTGLGFWQLARAQEKAALAGFWEARQSQAPAELELLWDRPAEELAYLPVRLAGVFLQDQYFLLDNRIQGGRFGYEVLGLVQLSGSDRLALVNRGWVAGDPARLALPSAPAPVGEVELVGHVYVAPGAPYLLAEQELAGGWPKLLQAVEMDKIVAVLDDTDGAALFPYAIRIAAGEAGALAVDWQVVNVSPEKHRAYAVQWFTMAAFLLIFYILRSSNLWQLLKPSGSEPN